MKLETLRQLIKQIPSTSEEEEFVKEQVLQYIDLYECDQEPNPNIFPIQYPPGVRGFDPFEPIEVPYNELCSCNPKNGGSGICGCVIGNKMVRNPKTIPGEMPRSFPPQDYGLGSEDC